MRVVPRLLQPIFTLASVLTLAAGQADQAESSFRVGNRFFDAGQFTNAVDMYTRALEQNAQDARAYFNRALANEMVDRKAAIRDWRQFLDLAGGNPTWKAAVSQVRDRLQTLERMPALPSSLQPSEYSPKSGDYFQEVAQSSKGLQFTTFPVKIFVGSVPRGWQGALRKALDAWIQVFPLEEVDSREAADIVLSWETLTKGSQWGLSADKDARRPGREKDWVQVVKEDDGTIAKRTKIAFVTLDSSHHWSEEQKRATALHEIGHALGIQGHSDRPGDVMFGTIQETLTEVANQGAVTSPPQYGPPPARTSPSLPQKPGPRDVNTLIRLYNSPGPLTRLGG